MDNMLVLLPKDEKPGFFFFGLFMDCLHAKIRSHLLTESIADPSWMATRVDELWTVPGRCSQDVVSSLNNSDNTGFYTPSPSTNNQRFQVYLSPRCLFSNSPAPRLRFSASHPPYLWSPLLVRLHAPLWHVFRYPLPNRSREDEKVIFLIQAGVLLEDWFQEVFFWEGLSKDIYLLSQACLDCHQSKVQTHFRSPIQQILVPGWRFLHIHIDLVEPLSQSCGYTFLFTIIHRTSRWPEAIPLQFKTAEECAKVLLRSWIPTFGVPSVITSDRGAQFTSWKEIHCGI